MNMQRLEEVDVRECSDIERATTLINLHFSRANKDGNHIVVEVYMAQDVEISFERIG